MRKFVLIAATVVGDVRDCMLAASQTAGQCRHSITTPPWRAARFCCSTISAALCQHRTSAGAVKKATSAYTCVNSTFTGDDSSTICSILLPF